MKVRRDVLLAMAAMLLAWLALMMALGRWQRGAAQRRPPAEPELIRYPGAENAPEQVSPNLGFRKYWFHLREDYPSESVFSFYQRTLEERGWRLVGQRRPDWVRRQEKDRAWDQFDATWVDPTRLFQLDLQMVSALTAVGPGEGREARGREPGIEVFVTQRRVSAPALLLPREKRREPRQEIETR